MSISTKSFHRSALMRRLNSFLNALQFPIHLQSPTELTPSLLIAILETLLSERVQDDIPSDNPDNINLQKTKIFLGVLGVDVLKGDVGLTNLDPHQLANGGLEECTYVAELLCWIGRMLNHIGDDPFEVHNEVPSVPCESHSPSTSITTTSFTTLDLSMRYASGSSISIDSSIPSNPTPTTTLRAAALKPRPRCIHEIPSPILTSFGVADPETMETETPRTPSPKKVRRTGYISPVDEELELLSFEQTRSSTSNTSHDFQDDHSFSLAALQESTARTIFLYQERARLLEEVARLESQQSQYP